MTKNPSHGNQLAAVGVHVLVYPRRSVPGEGPRFASMAVGHGLQIAHFRCTENGDWAGWGWVEYANGGGRRQFSRWADFLAAVGRHPMCEKGQDA